MPSIQFLKRKVQHSYLIWLEVSRKYVQMEEPAWFVFNKLGKKYKATTIAAKCVARYGLTPEESILYVNEIRSGIEQINQPPLLADPLLEYPTELKNYLFKPFSIHRYRFGDRLIEFSYGNQLLESFIHPLIVHLKTDESQAKIAVFELFGYNDKIAFRLDSQVKGVWETNESHLVKGLIFMNLVNRMFDKPEDFWLMTVHASAISNGRKTIVIPASPGSGKTTFAAMLQARGYQLVSDDFVPIDRYSFFAWPFPIAISVKNGSLDLLSGLYPQLKKTPLTKVSSDKSVRYIFPENHGEFSYKPCPVKEFIFIKYDQSIEFDWETLDKVRAIKLLLDQSWIQPGKEIADIILNKLTDWSFYQLTYSNNSKALAAITNLFDHD